MTTFLIDVSQWQGASLDWTAIDGAGIDGAIAKVTQGLTVDPDWTINRKGMLGTTLVPGGYAWLSPGVVPADAVKAYLTAMGDPNEFLCALDCEQTGITVAEIKAWAAAFDAAVPGHPLFIYIGRNTLSNLGHPDLHALGPWWEPYYPGGGTYPGDNSPVWTTGAGGWSGPTIWQYGPRTVPSDSHPVDSDAYRGTPADLAKYKGAAMTPAAITDQTPKMVTTFPNSVWYDLDGVTVLSSGHVALPSRVSPYAAGTMRAIYVTQSGLRRLALIKPASVADIPDATPFSQADVNASYNAGIDATVKQAGTTTRK